jgi:hypothetical protein
MAAPIAWSTRAAIKHRQRRGQGAEHRARGDHAEPVHAEQLAPNGVGDPTDDSDGRDEHEQIRQRDPLDRADARVEIATHAGQRERHDARVELPHECPDADRADHVPMRARAVSHRDRPSGLAQEPAPD